MIYSKESSKFFLKYIVVAFWDRKDSDSAWCSVLLKGLESLVISIEPIFLKTHQYSAFVQATVCVVACGLPTTTTHRSPAPHDYYTPSCESMAVTGIGFNYGNWHIGSHFLSIYHLISNLNVTFATHGTVKYNVHTDLLTYMRRCWWCMFRVRRWSP